MNLFIIRWLVLNNRVYDVQDFRSDNAAITEILQKYTGKDASPVINTSYPHLLPLMEHHLVGNYCLPEPETSTVGNLDYMHTCSMLLDCERNLGYLLGLHAFNLRQSLPQKDEEVQSKHWITAPFLSGGLQVDQPPNPYEEEKGESRSTNSTADNTPTEPNRGNVAQKMLKSFRLPIDRINSFISALAESRLSVSIYFINIFSYNNFNFEKHCVPASNNVVKLCDKKLPLIRKHLCLFWVFVGAS